MGRRAEVACVHITMLWQVDSAENVTIGQRLRRIRKARRKSLQVIAGLAGMSAPTLSRIETGQRALDSRACRGGAAGQGDGDGRRALSL